MGTHPIFESDFDCLTENGERTQIPFGRFDECNRELSDGNGVD